MYGSSGEASKSSWCLPDKGTMTIDAEIQLTAQLVKNSHQNHRKIQAQCSIIKIQASFQDLAVEEVESKKKILLDQVLEVERKRPRVLHVTQFGR